MAPRSVLGYAIPYLAVVGGLMLLDRAWIAVAAYQAGMVAFLARDRRRLPLGPRRRASRSDAATVLLGASAGPALALVWPLLFEDHAFRDHLRAAGLEGLGLLLFLITFSTVNVVLEESFWRGRPGRRARPDHTDLLFAGYHGLVLARFLPSAWVAVILMILVVTAWIWRRAAIRGESLFPALLSHGAAAIGISGVVWSHAG